MNEQTSLFGLVREAIEDFLFGPILDRGNWLADLHLLTRALVGETVTPVGGLTLRVDPDEARSLCERVLRDQEPQELLVPAARLAAAADWRSLAPLVASAIEHAEVDSDFVIDGSRALERMDSVSESVLASLRSRDPLATGSPIATGILIRRGTDADRERCLVSLREEIAGGDPDPAAPLLLRELHDAGLDVLPELRMLLQLPNLESWEPAIADLARLIADLAEPVSFSTLHANNNRDWILPLLLRMLHTPQAFEQCRDPLRQYVSTHVSSAEDEAAAGLTLLGRMGEDRAFLEPYLRFDNWMVRIGAYLGLADSLDRQSFASLSEDETDSDARAVLEYVCFRNDAGEVPGLQRRVASSAFSFNAIRRTLVHDLRTSFASGTPLATIRAVDLRQAVSGSDLSTVLPWYHESDLEIVTDVASWSSTNDETRFLLSLCAANDAAAAATLESIAIHATDETELGTALTCLSALGGPGSVVGRTLERLLCTTPDEPWIGEEEYPAVECVVWSGLASLRRSCLSALKPEVIRRRPVLLESFWRSRNSADAAEARRVVMKAVRDGVGGTPMLDAISTLDRGGDPTEIDLSPLVTVLQEDPIEDAQAIAEIRDALVHRNAPQYLRGEFAWESAGGGSEVDVAALAEASGVSQADVLDLLAGSSSWRSRQRAANAASAAPDPAYRDTIIRLISTAHDEDVIQAAREAWEAINRGFPQTDPCLIVVTPDEADDDESVPASLIESLRESSCAPDELAPEIGRHVILEPVGSVPDQPGTVSQREFESLALHMQVQFHDEDSDAVVVEIIEDETIEALNLLAAGKSGRVLAGRWT